MNREDLARLASETSPLLTEVHELNMALRRRWAAVAYLEASTEPAQGTKADCAEGWEGYKAEQQKRRALLSEAETGLSFAVRAAEKRLARSLTADEAARGVGTSVRPGWAGVRAAAEHLKPNRTIAPQGDAA